MEQVVYSCQLAAAVNTKPVFCSWLQVSAGESWGNQVKMKLGERKRHPPKNLRSPRNSVLHNVKKSFPNKLIFSILT